MIFSTEEAEASTVDMDFDVIELTNMQQIFVALFFHFWSTMLCFEKFMVYNSDGLGPEKTNQAKLDPGPGLSPSLI